MRRSSQRTALTAGQQEILDDVLRNEADMAYRRRVRVLAEYLELADGDRVFDAGCGMGFYLLAFGKLRRLQLVGLDRDFGRLQSAQRSVHGGVTSGDLQRLPFADSTFDKVLMTEVLEHVASDSMALAEAYRVLRPGGILAISVPHASYPFWWDPINRVWIALGGSPIRSGPLVGIWTGHERLYTPSALAERVLAAGFTVETVEEATHFAFPFSHFLLYGVGKPLVERHLLPPALHAQADRMAAAQGQPSGSWSPITVAVAALAAVDRLNEHPDVARKTTFVNVLLKARKRPTTTPYF